MKLEVLEKLGYRTDTIAPSEIDILFDDAMQLLRDRIAVESPELLQRFDDRIADIEEEDLRDRISEMARENLSPQIEKFNLVIGRKLKQWQKEGLSLEEARDRIDSIYSLDEYGDEGFANGLAEWLAIATLTGQDQIESA
jgi:tRNA A37 N6-isopentenylltransferase MiaA